MSIRIVPDELFSYLMETVAGARFENFSKQLFSLVFKETFIPMGGIHDGGADGALSSYIQEVSGKPNTFVQFSSTADTAAKTKVRGTITALRKCGRTPMQLIYATSVALPKSDIIAQEIIDEFGVMVQFRDYERIKNYINMDEKNNRLFYDFFAPEILSINHAADKNLKAVNEYSTDPTVYVYLNYELNNKHTKNHLNEQVLDALIYWSLRDTDPDKSILVARRNIHTTISELFPQAQKVLLPRLDKRLQALIAKEAGGIERLRHYRSSDSFCLPYEMRTVLAIEASIALANQQKFRDSITARLNGEIDGFDKSPQNDACNELVFRTVHSYFVDQGILLAAFLEGKLETVHISDQVVEDIMVRVLSEIDHGKSLTPETWGACLSALRGIFYHPSGAEREYMGYLSKTSCLLVTMQSAPRLLEYFNKMGGNFRLLVGTDLLVKAISERYVEPENQQVTRLLEVCKQLGSELTLTEPVLNEVFTHLHAVDMEFKNHYAEQEQYLRDDMTIDSDRIMIRAYFHARKSAGGPKTWAQFIEQVVTHSALRNKSESARHDLKGFFVQKFSMKYLTTEDLTFSVNLEKVKDLAAKLDEARESRHENLSFNDALMAFATYAQRRKLEESGIYDGFGYRTWWLTKETHVLHFSKGLVESQGGVPYIMRPEFILNFVSLASNADNVRKAFSNMLPTTAGLQLGRHLSSETMYKLMGDAAEWGDKPAERITMMISERANKLKHDQFKKYSDNIGHHDEH